MKISAFLLVISLVNTLKPRPVRVFHGLMMDCDVSLGPGYRCVESGAGMDSLLKSITEQAAKACDYLVYEKDALQNGFYILAFSQGGLIARTILHKCTPINKFIKRIVFVGTPHLGLIKFPKTRDFNSKSISTMEKEMADLKSKQSTMDPSEYQRYLDDMAQEQMNLEIRDTMTKMQDKGIGALNSIGGKFANFITDSAPTNYLNSEMNDKGYRDLIKDLSDTVWDERYAQLELLVNIVSMTETIITPVSSTAFGSDLLKDGKKNPNIGDNPYFTTHANGIGALLKSGRLVNCLSKDTHAAMTNDEEAVIFNLFNEVKDAANYQESAEKLLGWFGVNYPIFCQYDDTFKTRSAQFKQSQANLDFTEHEA